MIMAITVEKLKGGYEFFSIMGEGYYLTLPNGKTESFLYYSELEDYCKENGIEDILN